MSKLNLVQDDFDSQLATWGVFNVTLSGGAAVFSGTSDLISDLSTYDLSNSSIYWQIPTANLSADSGQFLMGVIDTTSFSPLQFVLFNDGTGIKVVDAFQTQTPINYVDGMWFRLRHDGTLVYMETSLDGSSWTVFLSDTASNFFLSSLSDMSIQYNCFASTGESVELDNINIPTNTVVFESVTQTSSDSFSHSTSGSDRLLIVSAHWSVSSSRSVSGITYNGASLTQIGSQISNGNSQVTVWYLLNPATGSNTLTISGTLTGGQFTAVSYSGVDQTSPIGVTNTATGSVNNSNPAIVSLTTGSDNSRLLQAIATSGSANTTDYTFSPPAIERSKASSGTGVAIVADRNTASTGSYGTQLNRSVSTLRSYSIILIEIKRSIPGGSTSIEPADISLSLPIDTTTVVENADNITTQDVATALSLDTTSIVENNVIQTQDIQIDLTIDSTTVSTGGSGGSPPTVVATEGNYQATTSNTNQSIGPHPGAAVGDLLIVSVKFRSGTITLDESGWTTISTSAGGVVVSRVLTDASIPYSFTSSAGSRSTLGAVWVRDHDGINTSVSSSTSSSSSQTGPTLTITNANCLLLHIATVSNGYEITPPSELDVVYSYGPPTTLSATHQDAGTEVLSAATTSTARVWTMSGSTGGIAHTIIAITPNGAPPEETTIIPNDLSTSASLDNATITQNHVIVAQDIDISPTLDSTTINQNHLLVPSDLIQGLSVDTTIVEEVYVIEPFSLLLTTSIDSTQISQNHLIGSNGLTLATIFDNATIVESNVILGVDSLSLVPSVGETLVLLPHILVTQGLSHGLSVDTTTIAQNHNLTPLDVAHALRIDSTALTGNHVLSPQEITHALGIDEFEFTIVFVLETESIYHELLLARASIQYTNVPVTELLVVAKQNDTLVVTSRESGIASRRLLDIAISVTRPSNDFITVVTNEQNLTGQASPNIELSVIKKENTVVFIRK